MKRVLVVTHSHFWRKQNGAAYRISTLITALQGAGYEVGLFFVGLLQKDDCNQLDRLGIIHRSSVIDGTNLVYHAFFTALPSVWICLPRYLLKVWYRFRKRSFPFERLPNPKIIHRLKSFLYIFAPDVVLVEYIRFSFLIPETRSRRQLWLIDTHDVMYKRYNSFKKLGLLHWVEIKREQEVEALSAFDAVIAIQKEEADLFHRMIKDCPVLIVPHCVDILPLPRRDSNEICIGYLAANNPVNYDALSWFLDRIWPACQNRFSEIRLRIGGAICRRLAGRSDVGVELVGYVNQREEFYSTVDIVVNPVRTGGGLKIKNIEALAVGRPLVTSPVGAQGFPQPDAESYVVASSQQEFISELIELINNPDRREILRQNGLKYVKKYFSCEGAYKPLYDFLENFGIKAGKSRC